MFANPGATPRERIDAIAQSAANLAGSTCDEIAEELARLMAFEPTPAEFGELLADAWTAWETTVWALCELKAARERRGEP